MLIRSMLLAATTLAAAIAPSAAAPVGSGKIAYVRDGGVWTINDDGTGDSHLVDAVLGPLRSLLWSPDGSRLAGIANGAFIVPAAGDEPIFLGPNTRTGCWLGNDRLAVVVETGDPNSPHDDIYIAEASGAFSTRLTFDGVPKALGEQGCARDGSKVVYTRFDPNTSGTFAPRTYVVATVGGNPVRLTPDSAADSSPALAPDARSVALVRGSLVVQDLVMGNERVLTQVRVETPPLWSPDGRTLLFETRRDDCCSDRVPEHFQIHEVAADGSGERDVTPSDGPSSMQPRWSPDGNRILFLSQRPNTVSNLWSANVDGTCPTPVASTTGSAFDWQPVPDQTPATPARCADLTVAANGPVAAPASGEPGITVMSLRNMGNETAPAVEIAFAPPAEARDLALESSTGTCDAASLRCRLDELPVGATVTIVARWRSDVPLDFRGSAVPVPETLTVTASNANWDPDPSNNTIRLLTLTYPCSQVGHGSYPFDRLVGTATRDVLCGLAGADKLFGRGGADTLVGGPGFDFLDGGSGRDVLKGGGERDMILASDAEVDQVDCGGAPEDVAVVDRVDHVRGCGIVVFPSVLCSRVGTRGNDHLLGTPKRDSLCGLGGGDTIEAGGGADALDGGQGNDTVNGGPGHDRVFGGAGYDTLLARDGVRDVVDCGKGVDTAIVDPVDEVAKNCENVRGNGR